MVVSNSRVWLDLISLGGMLKIWILRQKHQAFATVFILRSNEFYKMWVKPFSKSHCKALPFMLLIRSPVGFSLGHTGVLTTVLLGHH